MVVNYNSIKSRPSVTSTRAVSTSEDVRYFDQKYCIIFGAAMQAEPLFARLLFLYLFLHNYNRGDTMTEQKSDELRMGALYIRVSTHEQDELSPDAQKRLLLD